MDATEPRLNTTPERAIAELESKLTMRESDIAGAQVTDVHVQGHQVSRRSSGIVTVARFMLAS